MQIANIISIIGNNSSATPIFVKDGIESSAKVYLANQQGQKVSKEQGFYEARETAIEEFGAATIWFLGPKVINKAFNFVTKNILSLKNEKLLNIDSKLLDGKHFQTLGKNLENTKDKFIKEDAKKLTTKSDNLISNLSILTKSKYGLGIGLSIGILAGLTILKQKITESSINKHGSPKGLSFNGYMQSKFSNHPAFSAFIDRKKSQSQPQSPSFKGIGELVGQASIDAGIGGIRVATARDKDERKEYIFKTITFIIFNYLSAPIIEKIINKIANAFKLPIALDPVVLADKNFVKDVSEAAKDNKTKEKMLEFARTDKVSSEIGKEETIINFIDEEIKKGVYDKNGNFEKFNNKTLELAQKTGLIKIENNQRATTKFINTKQVEKINENLKDVIKAASEKGSVESLMQKVKHIKYASVLANIAICSAIVGVVLPKIQYMFRERGIGTVASPGVKASNQHVKKA